MSTQKETNGLKQQDNKGFNEEELLSQQEDEQVEGGIDNIKINNPDDGDPDDKNYFQCECNNNKCGQ